MSPQYPLNRRFGEFSQSGHLEKIKVCCCWHVSSGREYFPWPRVDRELVHLIILTLLRTSTLTPHYAVSSRPRRCCYYYYYYYYYGRAPPCLPPLIFRNISPQAFSTVGQVECPVSVKSGAICVGQRFIRSILRSFVRVTCGNRAAACYRHSVEHKVRQVYRPESQHHRDVPLSKQHKKQSVCDVPLSEHAAVCAVLGCKCDPESANLIKVYGGFPQSLSPSASTVVYLKLR